MQYFDFQGLKLSNIALGCDHYGETISEENAIANLDLYLQKGGNILDTARVYGQDKPLGVSTSETLLGRWMGKTIPETKCSSSPRGAIP